MSSIKIWMYVSKIIFLELQNAAVKGEETRLSAMYLGLVDCVDVLPAAVLLCVLSAWI
jgi:hypothetical protein